MRNVNGFIPLWSKRNQTRFILTMRNVNDFMKDITYKHDAGFILTMRNVNMVIQVVYFLVVIVLY